MINPASDELIAEIEAEIRDDLDGEVIIGFSPEDVSALIARIRKEQEATAKAEAEKAVMARALEPLNLDDWADENGWTEYACKNDPIHYWFGPSDFRDASAAITGTGSTIISDMEAEIERLRKALNLIGEGHEMFPNQMKAIARAAIKGPSNA